MAVGLDPHAARISPPPATGTPPAREASPTGLSGARSEIQENSSDNSSQESLCTCISRIISQLWAIIRQCFCGATGGDTTTTEEATRTATPTQGSQITDGAPSPSNPTPTEEATRTATPTQGSQITDGAPSPSNPTPTEEASRAMTPAQGSQITGDASSPSNPTATEEATRTMTPPQGSQITDGASSPSNPTATEGATHRTLFTQGKEIIKSHCAEVRDLEHGAVFTMVITYNGISTMPCALVLSPQAQDMFTKTCLQGLKNLLLQDGNRNCNDGLLEVATRVVTKDSDDNFNLNSIDSSTRCNPHEETTHSGKTSTQAKDADAMWLCLQPMLHSCGLEDVEGEGLRAALTLLGFPQI